MARYFWGHAMVAKSAAFRTACIRSKAKANQMRQAKVFPEFKHCSLEAGQSPGNPRRSARRRP
eukprot:963627-Pleurochrysis_carterae.AAC.1